MTLKSLKLCQALMLAGVMTSAVAAPGTRTYIVQMAGAPAASYTGGVAGLKATQVAEGQRLDSRSADVKAYRAHLAKERQALLNAAGVTKPMYQYDLVFNGFAAELTEAQVKKLQASGKVLNVLADERRDAQTVSTPHFLGLDIAGGVWSQRAGGSKDKGEDIIVAVIDSGVQPENPAFYDRVDSNGVPVKTGGKLAYGPAPAKWMGGCVTGAGFPVDACNNKLIGAKVFSTAFKGYVDSGQIKNQFEYNFYDVARDEGGHGTHTLSTIGGNANAPAVTSTGVTIGATSGIAPRARLASYKALFGVYDSTGALSGSGYNADLVAAINAAVEDGVDVINYSVSGSQTNVIDPVEVAFFNAAASGVFVAASAGNSGPGNQVAHPSPWITTVAASTHDRQLVADLGLAGASSYTGASFNATALPSAPMVLSSDIPAAGVAVADANLCFLNSLDMSKAAGKIVVCDRGTNARVEKSAEVKRVGGVGMVLINPSANTLVADFHSVPTVHLQNTARTAVRGYVTAQGTAAAGSIGAAYQAAGVVAPVMASFSSRGPNLAENSVMKPDITAPGVDIIASVAYRQTSQAEHDAILGGAAVPPVVDSYQGTSMSSPHIAGVAALLKQRYPNWSPAMIKSAMMTSTTGVKLASGAADTNLFGYGAGHVNPNGAIDPGLVYPATTLDYLRFLCGASWLSATGGTCSTYGAIKPTDLNLPSFALDVTGTMTVKRRVRNVGPAGTYTASASMPGFNVEVSPSSLTLAKGEVGHFTVTFTTTTAPIGSRVFGSLTWSDGTHKVTSPVQARALSVAAPALLTSSDATGSASYKVTYGFGGAASSVVAGLKAATPSTGTVATGASTCFDLSVPAGALAIRAALYDADTSGAGADDLDLELYNPAGTRIAYSGGATATELVNVLKPAAGTYKACVVGYATKDASSSFTLSSWVLSSADAGGSLSAKGLPSSVAIGDEAKVRLSWAGLTGGSRYLGAVGYMDSTGATVGTTLLAVEPAATLATQRGAEMAGRKALRKAAR